jgi:thiamine biosynthesis lipoprotein
MPLPTTVVDCPAMGTRLQVLLIDADGSAEKFAADRVAELERAWSRFRPDSEVSALNRAQGSPVAVSADTRHLLRVARQLWRATDGAFDPTVLPALEDVGYDRSFKTMDTTSGREDLPVRPSPGLADMVIDEADGTVTLPASVLVDPGGFGKGLAADLIVEELLTSGKAAGALVNLGGDLRAGGVWPPTGWGVTLEDPESMTLGLTHGAVATSSTTKRRWQGPDGSLRHHVIDPRTGRSVDMAPRSVTVVAPTATMAEALATWLMVAPEQARPRLPEFQATAMSVASDGTVHLEDGMEEYLW